jgi:hypothetical protein
VVQTSVLGSTDNEQVLGPVVSLVAVAVVDDLVDGQRSAE